MQVKPVGPDAVLVEVADAGQALDLALWLREHVAADEVVPAAASVLVDGVTDAEALAARLEDWRPGAVPVSGDRVTIEVDYSGPDLAVVADLWGVPVDEVVARHAAGEYVVAFAGFAPGFAYLLRTDAEVAAVPRRATPRTRVEPGSVGLAGTFTGLYPSASPGGWQLIGRTDAALWDQDRPSPALLPPGTPVRFEAR